MLYLFILIAFVGAACSPLQTAVNSKMSQIVRSPLLSAFISFIVSTVIVGGITLAADHTLLPDATVAAALPWWGWLGGVLGVVGVTLLIVIFPKLGGVQTVLLPMLGITLTSMLIDTFGWCGYEAQSIQTARIVGLLFVIIGLVLYTMPAKDQGSKVHTPWVYRLFGIVVGVMFALQPAVNGYVATQCGSSFFASWLSFAESDVIFLILLLFMPQARRHARNAFRQSDDRPWWVWLGGLFGAIYVITFAHFTPLIGVTLISVTSVFAQLTSSTLIDRFGWFGAMRKSIAVRQYVALAIVLVGTLVMNIW